MADRVNIKNLDATLKLLKAYAPEQSKEITKRITKAANEFRDAGRREIMNVRYGYFALRRWGSWTEEKSGRDLSFNAAIAASNMKVTRARNRRRGIITSNYIGVVSNDGPGVIFQTAGKGSSGSDFVGHLMRKYPLPRGLWKAEETHGAIVREAILQGVRDAQDIVQKQLNSMGE